jgi:hypothetical protein
MGAMWDFARRNRKTNIAIQGGRTTRNPAFVSSLTGKAHDMGSALFIVLEHEIPGFDQSEYSKDLAQASEELDGVAATLDVLPLMSFFSKDAEEVAEFLDDEGVALDEMPIPDETWYTAADGLKTVDALLGHYQSVANPTPQTGQIIQDLKEFQSVLRRAEAEGVRWHLDVDF